MKLYKGILIIAFATLASLIIANLPSDRDAGLGFIILWLWPPIIGGFGMILFLLLRLVTKSPFYQIGFCILWSVYLVYVGIGLYVDNGWPFI